jgi:hypothetical protein
MIQVLYDGEQLFSSSLGSGRKYSEFPPTMMITILNDLLFPHETDRFHTVFHLREDEAFFLWSRHIKFHAMDLSQLMVNERKIDGR